MSELLLRWVVEDVGVSASLTNIEQALSTGYVLGELLHRLNLQPDFAKFDASGTPDAIISNFTRLHATLRHLGVKFDSKMANSLIRKEKGAAMHLLYAAVTEKQATMASTKGGGGLGTKLGVQTRISLPMLQTQQHRSPLAKHDAAELARLEELLRLRASNPKALSQELHVKPFHDAGLRQQAQAAAAIRVEAADKVKARSRFRDQQRAHKASIKAQLDEFDARVSQVHADSQRKRHAMESADLRVEMTLAEKAAARQELARHSVEQNVRGSIEAFEAKLAAAAAETTDIANSGRHRADCVEQYPAEKQVMQQEAEAYLQRMHAKHSSALEASRERTLRRRRLTMEQQAASEALEQQSKLDTLLASLYKKSAEERRVAERLEQLRKEQQVLEQNRAQRLRQYGERRERDWEEALARERQLMLAMKEQSAGDTERERRAWRKAREQRKAGQESKRTALVRDFVRDLSEFALRVAGFRERTGTSIPKAEYTDLLALLCKSDPSLCPSTRSDADVSAVEDAVVVAALNDFLHSKGEWSVVDPTGFNCALGDAVQRVRLLAHPPPTSGSVHLTMPVRIAVVGAPFTGKSTLAHELATAYHASVLEPERLVHEAIAAADAYVPLKIESGAAHENAIEEDPMAEQSSPELQPLSSTKHASQPSRIVELGRIAQDLLVDGELLPDQYVVELVVLAVQSLEAAYNAAASHNAQECIGNGSIPQGFVLDGFPRTREQAVLFEKAFSGLDLEGEAAYVAGASRIAPPSSPALPSPQRPLKSCIDTAIILELEDAELSIERAIGQRLDPESGRTFHLRFAPPPDDDPGLLERLVSARSGSNDAEQIRTRMEAHLNTAPALNEWLGRFQTLAHRIDSDRPIAELTERALAIAKTVEDCRAGARLCEDAAQVAAKAQADAQAAASAATAAAAAARAAARELLLAKTAELEAQKILAAPEAPAKGAKKGKADPAEEAAAAEAAASATRVLAVEAAARCAEHLKVGNAAKDEAERQMAAAQGCAASAEAAAARARRFQGNADRSADAQECAATAATAAAEAALAASAAQDAAVTAAQQAAAVVAKAQGKLDSATEHGSLELSDDDAGAPADVEAQDRGDDNQAGVPHLGDEAVQYLSTLWKQTEDSFVHGITTAFAGIRSARASVVEHCGRGCEDVRAQLARPDGQQAALSAFVASLNRTELDLLRVPDVQAELVLQADELQERLWAMCDVKRAESQAVLAKVTDEAFGKGVTDALAGHFIGAMQADIDRFMAASWFALDISALEAGEELPQRMSQLVDLTEKPAGELAPLLDAKSGMPTPEWVAAAGAPAGVQQAARVAVALVALQERHAVGTSADAADKKKAAKGKAATAAVTPEQEAALDRVRIAAAPMLEHERQIAVARIRAAIIRAAAHDSEVSGVLIGCAERLRKAISDQHTLECERVASAIAVIKDAVESGSRVAHDLRLGADAVCVDLSTELLPLQPSQPAATVHRAERGTGVLDLEHLQSLLSCVLDCTQHPFMPVVQMAELMQRMTVAPQEAPFPPRWPEASHKQMHDALQLFDAHESGYLDWRHVLCSLLLLAVPALVQAGANEFGSAAKALCAASAGRQGGITQSEWMTCALWFEADGKAPGCSQDLEAGGPEHDADSAQPSTHLQDTRAIKCLLWRMFSRPAADNLSHANDASPNDVQEPPDAAVGSHGEAVDGGGDGALMDAHLPLLYLAADRERMLAVRKAFAVLAHNTSRKAQLSHTELLKLLYPGGTQAGASIHKVPYSAEDVQSMMGDIGRGPSDPGSAVVTAEQLVYSVSGARLLTACAPQYELRDLYLDMWRIRPVPNSM